MERKYITVFGATGRIGVVLLQFLSSAGIPAIAVTRNKNKAVPMPFVEWMEADKNSPLYIAKAHGEVEEVLKASGIPWTILQPNGFMQNWLGEFSQIVAAKPGVTRLNPATRHTAQTGRRRPARSFLQILRHKTKLLLERSGKMMRVFVPDPVRHFIDIHLFLQ
jgi:uncharacterized protein YbjT (DUF2867 family)